MTTLDERDNQIGRAIVDDDSQDFQKYYDDLAKFEAGALWTVANDIEPWEPQANSVPILWSFQDLRPYIIKSSQMVSPEKAGRRVVYLRNPLRKKTSAVCGHLFSGLQIMRPGEKTSAHRHKASALRFIMEGSGAYTTVDGHKIDLRARDFVLTPNSTWHDHGVNEDGETSIWQDGLDIPLTNVLCANDYEVHKNIYQDMKYPLNDSSLTYGGVGVMPGVLPESDKWDKAYSPLMRFGWDETYQALQNYAKVSAGCPYDGLIMRYTNPKDGGYVMQTMSASMQMLLPDQHTKAHRHTGNVIYNVAKGSGSTIINGKKFDWQEKDIFCVPTWCWHEHINSSQSDDACLFSFNDFPVMTKLGFYQEQAYKDNNGYQII